MNKMDRYGTSTPTGHACSDCGWEWAGAEPPPDPGPCGAHIGGVTCPAPEAFVEYNRHVAAGCFADGGWHDSPNCPSQQAAS